MARSLVGIDLVGSVVGRLFEKAMVGESIWLYKGSNHTGWRSRWLYRVEVGFAGESLMVMCSDYCYYLIGIEIRQK